MSDELLTEIRVIVARTEVKVDGLLSDNLDHEARIRKLEQAPAALTAQKLWASIVAGSGLVATLASIASFFIIR